MTLDMHFDGFVAMSPRLNRHEFEYLMKFHCSRRMNRIEGPYYVGGGSYLSLAHPSMVGVVDPDSPPIGQPDLWCPWKPVEGGAGISANDFFDGSSHSSNPARWMQYLIDNFLKRQAFAVNDPDFSWFTFNHILNGEVSMIIDGMESRIIVKNNVVHEILSSEFGEDS